MEHLKNYTDNNLLNELIKRGYAIRHVWHASYIDDIIEHFYPEKEKLSEKEKIEVINNTLDTLIEDDFDCALRRILQFKYDSLMYKK